jgi:hypothetical protein
MAKLGGTIVSSLRGGENFVSRQLCFFDDEISIINYLNIMHYFFKIAAILY